MKKKKKTTTTTTKKKAYCMNKTKEMEATNMNLGF